MSGRSIVSREVNSRTLSLGGETLVHLTTVGSWVEGEWSFGEVGRFLKLADFSSNLLVVPFWLVLYEFWELGAHFLARFGSGTFFSKIIFL